MAKANPIRFSTKYQDDETDLLYYGYRYYSASTGRWVSRDPDEEDGGENLYEFSGDDPVDLYDLLGLIWRIYRSPAGDRALVNGDCGDTVRELAVGIRLDPADYHRWLRLAGGNNIYPASVDDPVDPYTWFSVPNKVYVNDLIGIDWNIWWQPWKWAEKQALDRQGFKVTEVDNTLRAQFLPQFSDADTYGIVVIAHGDPNRRGDFSDAGPDYVTPAEAAGRLNHKLGGFKAIWCYSGVKRQEWRALVSPNGWFYSKRGQIHIWDAQPGVIHHGF